MNIERVSYVVKMTINRQMRKLNEKKRRGDIGQFQEGQKDMFWKEVSRMRILSYSELRTHHLLSPQTSLLTAIWTDISNVLVINHIYEQAEICST